jgi:hypothetical protein
MNLSETSRTPGCEKLEGPSVIADCGRMTGNSPGNKRVSRLFPVTTDGAKRRPVLGSNANVADGNSQGYRLGRDSPNNPSLAAPSDTT